MTSYSPAFDVLSPEQQHQKNESRHTLRSPRYHKKSGHGDEQTGSKPGHKRSLAQRLPFLSGLNHRRANKSMVKHAAISKGDSGLALDVDSDDKESNSTCFERVTVRGRFMVQDVITLSPACSPRSKSMPELSKLSLSLSNQSKTSSIDSHRRKHTKADPMELGSFGSMGSKKKQKSVNWLEDVSIIELEYDYDRRLESADSAIFDSSDSICEDEEDSSEESDDERSSASGSDTGSVVINVEEEDGWDFS
eukprot:Colp12_sorted_trinity150504_noHs@24852